MLRLSNVQKQSLLDIARRAVESRLHGQGLPPPGRAGVEFPEARCGVFVSIHAAGELRGCIGRISSDQRLVPTTADCAVSAAFGDPRFPPLETEELEHATFEVSVLSPLERVERADAIEVGRHGILIEKQGRRGLLLPQVAVSHQWNRDEFLRQTALKAGLDPEAWRTGAVLSVFEAVVFREGAL